MLAVYLKLTIRERLCSLGFLESPKQGGSYQIEETAAGTRVLVTTCRHCNCTIRPVTDKKADPVSQVVLDGASAGLMPGFGSPHDRISDYVLRHRLKAVEPAITR